MGYGKSHILVWNSVRIFRTPLNEYPPSSVLSLTWSANDQAKLALLHIYFLIGNPSKWRQPRAELWTGRQKDTCGLDKCTWCRWSHALLKRTLMFHWTRTWHDVMMTWQYDIRDTTCICGSIELGKEAKFGNADFNMQQGNGKDCISFVIVVHLCLSSLFREWDGCSTSKTIGLLAIRSPGVATNALMAKPGSQGSEHQPRSWSPHTMDGAQQFACLLFSKQTRPQPMAKFKPDSAEE